MSENNNEEKEFKVDIDKEELKSQAKDTVNQTKETIKNMNWKEEAGNTKSFVLNMIKEPLTTIKKITSGTENHFSVALIIMIVLMVGEALAYILRIAFSKYAGKVVFGTLCLNLFNPLLYVLAFAIAAFIFGGKDKKNIVTMLTAFTVAKVPELVRIIVGIVDSIIDIKLVGYIYSIVSSTVSFLIFSMMFIAIKDLVTSSEDDDKDYRKVVVIVAVAYTILKLLTICGIY